MKDKKKKTKRPIMFKFALWITGVFYGKIEYVGLENIPKDPCLIIGNHTQIHGPYCAMKYFPYPKQIWCKGQMMKVKEVPAYAYQDFWYLKPKATRWLYKILSYLIAPLCAFLFSNADTIAVYHDKRVINTFKKSVEALNNSEYVFIFPENRTDYNEIVNDFSLGFVNVAKYYYKSTQKSIAFVPMYTTPALKKVVFGKPIIYSPHIDMEEQSVTICNHLKEEITRIAKELPRHKVVPYKNIKKKDYPYSK